MQVIEYLPHIAFTGKAGSGKTTAALALADAKGYRIVSFAEPIKRVAGILWGPRGRTDRDTLQWIGESVRSRDPGAFVRILEERLDDIHNNSSDANPRVVVDDLRMVPEYDMLREQGFIIVRIEAERHIRIDRLVATGKMGRQEELDDETETALDGYLFDYEVHNNSDPEDLSDQISMILRREGSRV